MLDEDDNSVLFYHRQVFKSDIHLPVHVTILLIKLKTCNQSCIVISVYRGVMVIVFNATFKHISVISWRSVLLVEETGVNGESH